MPEHEKPLADEQLRQLSHDLRECLHMIGMGVELLQKARQDAERFAQTCEAIDKERKAAQKLVGELIDAACRNYHRTRNL